MYRLIAILICCLFTFAKCGNCDGCGDLPESSYGIINKLNHDVKIRFSDSFQTTLQPNDTSQLWKATINPVGGLCNGYFLKYTINGSFPFTAESITILFDNESITFWRCQYPENCSFSIFEPKSWGSDGIAYFEVDSLSLCLK